MTTLAAAFTPAPVEAESRYPKVLAELTGVVLDQRAQPITGAEVTLSSIAGSTLTNERGEFRFTNLAAGNYVVVIRRLGYRELADSVTLRDETTLSREYFMKPVTTLDTVSVTSTVAIPSFEEHRRLGFGKFLTRAQLEKMEERKMAEILSEVGANVMRNGPRAWLTSPSNRGVRSLQNAYLKCKQLEGRPSANQPRPGDPGCGCFALVYLDGALLFNGKAGSLVPDVNGIVPASIEAIEYYKGPAQTPVRYSTLDSECGVLVLHTRRTPGSVLKKEP
jgi:hypothetical protein